MFILSNVLSLVATLGLTSSLVQSNVNALPTVRAELFLVSLLRVTTPYSFRCPLAAVTSLPRWEATSFVASSLLPTGFSRVGMCSSVHYGLIVDIHEVITCCRFSLHSILLPEYSFYKRKGTPTTVASITILHTTILYSVLMHVLLPHQYL